MLNPHLAKHFCKEKERIEQWFASSWQAFPPPIYGSIDLRYAGFKIAPIDMNLFPAGFNNLSERHLAKAREAARSNILRIVPHAKRILLIPESHTRNFFYWENIKTLRNLLEQAQFEVRIGMFAETQEVMAPILLNSGEKITVEPLLREENELKLTDFLPDVILLNNDLAEGVPAILNHLKQPVIPPAQLGWSQRLKSAHFEYYNQVADEFAKALNLDPWLISPFFQYCEPVDFMRQEGMACLIERAESLFEAIRRKYSEYQITHQPFLIIKADQGTYGMAVMTVRDVGELTQLNRKKRTQMSVTKGGQSVKRVILQEGVYTFETVGPNEAVAEPVVYLFGGEVVGGFYRVHQSRGVDENLNSPGMQFEPLPFSPSCTDEERIYLYGVIARLSMLAAAREIKESVPME